MKNTLKFLLLVVSLTLCAISTFAQTTPPAANTEQTVPGTANEDPIRQLNLSPDQREQIRVIREQNRDARATVNQRLRETNRALQEALDNDNPDEALVEQRLRDAAAAQAASMRLRILNEVKIRRVLTPEQRSLLRSMRREANGGRDARRLENLEQRQQRLENRSLKLRERRRVREPIIRRTPPRIN
jgi:Spy/CpxP family protein refolding chaperone